MVPRPLSRLLTWLSSASRWYSARCCQYAGPGSPVRVRVPRTIAVSNGAHVGRAYARVLSARVADWCAVLGGAVGVAGAAGADLGTGPATDDAGAVLQAAQDRAPSNARPER